MQNSDLKIYKSITQSTANKSTGGYLFVFISLFLSVLCFFVILNFNANQNLDKSKKLLGGLKQEFSEKSIKQKFKNLTNKDEFDSSLSFNETTFSQIKRIASQYKSSFNLKLTHSENFVSIKVPVTAVFNNFENRFRPDATAFFRKIAININNNYQSSKVRAGIYFYTPRAADSYDLKKLNYIYEIFERSNNSGYELSEYSVISTDSKNLNKLVINIANEAE